MERKMKISVKEFLQFISVREEIHIYDNETREPLGMIPAVENKEGLYTRETEDWLDNYWLYSDTWKPKKLNKQYNQEVLEKNVASITISGGMFSSLSIYVTSN